MWDVFRVAKNGRVGASQLVLVVKNPLVSEGDARD